VAICCARGGGGGSGGDGGERERFLLFNSIVNFKFSPSNRVTSFTKT